MPLDPRKRQKALERKAALAKKRKTERNRQQQFSKSAKAWERSVVREAAAWPLHEALIAEDWRNTKELAQILIARRSPTGEVVTGTFLVDLGCLGVKSAFPSKFDSVGEYETDFRDGILSQMPMVPTDLSLAAKVMAEAVDYAESLGFKPEPDYYVTKLILGDADPAQCPLPVPLGFEGKPFFVPGPYDDAEAVIAALTRKLGPDGFQTALPEEGILDVYPIELLGKGE